MPVKHGPNIVGIARLIFEGVVSVGVVLDQDCHAVRGFGQLVGRLLRGGLPQIRPVVLQDLVGGAQPNIIGRRVHVHRVDEDADRVAAHQPDAQITGLFHHRIEKALLVVLFSIHVGHQLLLLLLRRRAATGSHRVGRAAGELSDHGLHLGPGEGGGVGGGAEGRGCRGAGGRVLLLLLVLEHRRSGPDRFGRVARCRRSGARRRRVRSYLVLFLILLVLFAGLFILLL